MNPEVTQPELRQQTQQLLEGPLKHVRAAALAAALLPLASIAATPAQAQSTCPIPASGGIAICGVVFNDANNNGFQDNGESGLEGVKVDIYDGTDTVQVETGPNGEYVYIAPTGDYTVSVLIPTGFQVSPLTDPTAPLGNDGESNNTPFSMATTQVAAENGHADFGFFPTPGTPPGTGTPGYWKNHPDAWPVSSITVGGVTYTKAKAIEWLKKVGKDKTTTMFSSLVPAILNVAIGNDESCISAAIAAGHAWMAANGPVGSNVPASSDAWSGSGYGQSTHNTLDAYNNGLLCAPHRD